MYKLMLNCSLSEINQGFEDSAKGTVIKPVITIGYRLPERPHRLR